jgi:hypothetical protein
MDFVWFLYSLNLRFLDEKRNKKIKPPNKKLETMIIIYLTATGSPPFNFKCIPSRSPSGSTRAMLPLRYCGVFYAFYLRARLIGMAFYFCSAPLCKKTVTNWTNLRF